MLNTPSNERSIMLAALAAVAILVLYFAVVSPYLDWRQEAVSTRETLGQKLQDARDLLDARTTAAAKWKDMVQPGIKVTASEAEGKIYENVYEWASESGVSVTMLKAQRSAEKTRLPEIKFTAQGTCTMRGLTELLRKIQSAKVPIRITELRLDTRKEAQDDVMFKMGLSTIYAPPAGQAPKTGGAK